MGLTFLEGYPFGSVLTLCALPINPMKLALHIGNVFTSITVIISPFHTGIIERMQSEFNIPGAVLERSVCSHRNMALKRQARLQVQEGTL